MAERGNKRAEGINETAEIGEKWKFVYRKIGMIWIGLKKSVYKLQFFNKSKMNIVGNQS